MGVSESSRAVFLGIVRHVTCILLVTVGLVAAGCGVGSTASDSPKGNREAPAKQAERTASGADNSHSTREGDSTDDADDANDSPGKPPREAENGSSRGDDGTAAKATERAADSSDNSLLTREGAPVDDANAFPGKPPGEAIEGDGSASPGTPLALKQAAGRILAEMEREGAFDPSQAFEQLRASVQGTMRNNVYLERGEVAFEHDERAVAELLEAYDAPDGTQTEQAQKALDLIFGAERLVSARPLDAIGELDGGQSESAGIEADLARKDLLRAGAAERSGRELQAVQLYRNAWLHTVRARNESFSLLDPDGDGLIDQIENRAGTDPREGDTDGDGIGDGREILDLGSDPLKADPPNSDLDDDGVPDREELERGTNPLGP